MDLQSNCCFNFGMQSTIGVYSRMLLALWAGMTVYRCVSGAEWHAHKQEE